MAPQCPAICGNAHQRIAAAREGQVTTVLRPGRIGVDSLKRTLSRGAAFEVLTQMWLPVASRMTTAASLSLRCPRGEVVRTLTVASNVDRQLRMVLKWRCPVIHAGCRDHA